MGEHTPFSLRSRGRSFSFALAGIATLLREEHNAWLHALATVIVIAAGLLFGLPATSWLALVLVIALVWMAEAINTAIEILCDIVSPEFHPLVKKAKDLAAAAVLIAATGAIVVGALVFFPRLR